MGWARPGSGHKSYEQKDPAPGFSTPQRPAGNSACFRHAPKYHRVNSCNVHYQHSVHPTEGTRLAQISWRRWWMLCTGSRRHSLVAHTCSCMRLVPPWRGRGLRRAPV